MAPIAFLLSPSSPFKTRWATAQREKTNQVEKVYALLTAHNLNSHEGMSVPTCSTVLFWFSLSTSWSRFTVSSLLSIFTGRGWLSIVHLPSSAGFIPGGRGQLCVTEPFDSLFSSLSTTPDTGTPPQACGGEGYSFLLPLLSAGLGWLLMLWGGTSCCPSSSRGWISMLTLLTVAKDAFVPFRNSCAGTLVTNSIGEEEGSVLSLLALWCWECFLSFCGKKEKQPTMLQGSPFPLLNILLAFSWQHLCSSSCKVETWTSPHRFSPFAMVGGRLREVLTFYVCQDHRRRVTGPVVESFLSRLSTFPGKTDQRAAITIHSVLVNPRITQLLEINRTESHTP